MTSHLGTINYRCPNCKKSKNRSLPHEIHQKYVEDSKNGIAIYSDIHRCVNGLLGVANLRVDANYSVRSVEYQGKNEEESKPTSIPFIPVPTNRALDQSIYRVTTLSSGDSLRFALYNSDKSIHMNVGGVDKEDIPFTILKSNKENYYLEYHDSDIDYNDFIGTWFVHVLNLIEDAQDVEMGLLLETLIYLQDNYYREIEDMDLQAMKLIINSKDIIVVIKDNSNVDTIYKNKNYTDKDKAIIKNIISEILRPNFKLIDLMSVNPNFVKLIYYVLILESYGVLELT